MKLFSTLTILSSLLCLSNLVATPGLAQGKVRVVVSVDWEGSDLEAQNIAAMQDFRRDYPGIPLQHFLNAAYYTKAGANPAQITSTIRSVLLKGDEHGLHIHAWRSLFLASGVKFRTSPSFVEGTVDLSNCRPDCGEDVPLTAYTGTELRKVIRNSVKILHTQGFDRARSFRAGGWQANDKVLNALAAEGITLDSSATYAEFLREAWGDYNLYSYVGRLWPKTRATSQPYNYRTSAGLNIIELPNIGCLSDYMEGQAMFEVFKANAAKWKMNQAQDVYVSIGFHQETAAEYLPHLRDGLDKIRAFAQSNGIPVEFVVAPL